MSAPEVRSVSTDQQRQRRFQAFQAEHAPRGWDCVEATTDCGCDYCELCSQPHQSGGKVCGLCRHELLATCDRLWTRFPDYQAYQAARSWAFSL